jgi:hypothetical protein
MRLIPAFAVSFLLHTIILGRSQAAIIIDNLASSTAGNSAVNGPPGPLETWAAIRFTTGTGTWQLNSLRARLNDQSNGGAGLNPDGLQIEVRSDAGTRHGNPIRSTARSRADARPTNALLFALIIPKKVKHSLSQIRPECS